MGHGTIKAVGEMGAVTPTGVIGSKQSPTSRKTARIGLPNSRGNQNRTEPTLTKNITRIRGEDQTEGKIDCPCGLGYVIRLAGKIKNFIFSSFGKSEAISKTVRPKPYSDALGTALINVQELTERFKEIGPTIRRRECPAAIQELEDLARKEGLTVKTNPEVFEAIKLLEKARTNYEAYVQLTNTLVEYKEVCSQIEEDLRRLKKDVSLLKDPFFQKPAKILGYWVKNEASYHSLRKKLPGIYKIFQADITGFSIKQRAKIQEILEEQKTSLAENREREFDQRLDALKTKFAEALKSRLEISAKMQMDHYGVWLDLGNKIDQKKKDLQLLKERFGKLKSNRDEIKKSTKEKQEALTREENQCQKEFRAALRSAPQNFIGLGVKYNLQQVSLDIKRGEIANQRTLLEDRERLVQDAMNDYNQVVTEIDGLQKMRIQEQKKIEQLQSEVILPMTAELIKISGETPSTKGISETLLAATKADIPEIRLGG